MKKLHALPQEIIGDYCLLGLLRHREHSEIWSAWRGDELPRRAVVKLTYFTHPRREQIQLTAKKLLNLPASRQLVQLRGEGKTACGDDYVVMEYISGQTLRHYVKHRGRLTPAQALTVLQSGLQALEVLHREQIVHRDLKPDNIYVRTDGSVVVSDYDLAQIAELPESTDTLWGTPGYLAPEQLRNLAPVDCRADFFSLGLTIGEALTGERLLAGESFAAELRELDQGQLGKKINDLTQFAPQALVGILARMLEKNPALRPDSASEILTELAALPLHATALS